MLIEVGVLSLVFAASSQRYSTGEHLLSGHSAPETILFTTDGQSEPSLLYSATLESALAKDFGLVSNIRHVLVERADDTLLVWIALDDPTTEVREKVFQKQFALIEGFPEISFDFNLVSARELSPAELASGAKVIYSREG